MNMFLSPINNIILFTLVNYKTSILISAIPINLIEDLFDRIRASEIDHGNCSQSTGTFAKAFDIIDFL